jgi:hypothetical protein
MISAFVREETPANWVDVHRRETLADLLDSHHYHVVRQGRVNAIMEHARQRGGLF